MGGEGHCGAAFAIPCHLWRDYGAGGGETGSGKLRTKKGEETRLNSSGVFRLESFCGL